MAFKCWSVDPHHANNGLFPRFRGLLYDDLSSFFASLFQVRTGYKGVFDLPFTTKLLKVYFNILFKGACLSVLFNSAIS